MATLQDALDASEARFRSLVEGAPDGIVISRDARVLYANPAAARMLGYGAPADLVGLHMSAFLDAAQIATMISRLASRDPGRSLAPFEYRAIRRDGSSLAAEITSLPIAYEGGPAVVAIARDVTERVRMRSQLAHADRLAAIGTLAAGVAHEVNNPLAYLSLGLSALQKHVAESIPDEKARNHALELIQEISGGADRVAGIVRDLRAFSRRDGEETGRVDLRLVLATAARMTSSHVRKRAQLSMDLDGATHAFGNAARLEQVFVNLILNAAQAIDGELGNVWVRTGTRESWVVVEVRDDGCGIAPENLPLIFDPFFTTKPIGSGTGLGLSVCLGIVRALGGDIEVETKPGTGTTFRVLLQAAPSEVQGRVEGPGDADPDR